MHTFFKSTIDQIVSAMRKAGETKLELVEHDKNGNVIVAFAICLDGDGRLLLDTIAPMMAECDPIGTQGE